MADSQDTVAVWSVPLQDKIHKVEFEHGTTTGKRVVRVDGQEVLRKDWMFKLVGKEQFTVGRMRCVVTVEALGTFAYEYSLEVNGKAYEKFREEQSKLLQTWNVNLGGEDSRICLDKGTMDIWVNGRKMDTAVMSKLQGEFVEDGTETHFEVGANVCYVKASSSGKKNVGVVHRLFINGNEMPPAASN